MIASGDPGEIVEQNGREGEAEGGRAGTEGAARRSAGRAPNYAAPEQRFESSGWPRGLEDPRRKSPALACILSVVPGLGQIYVGYYPRGFAHALVVAGLITVLSSARELDALAPLGGVFLGFFWLYNIIDAGRRAAMYNHILAGGDVVDLPKDIGVPGFRGSIVGGLTLMAVGAVILSHTAYDVSLAWLEDWWPAGLLLFGVYLVGKGIVERRQ